MAMDHHHPACAASSSDLPPLSPTYQTAPVLAPASLSRCTIDTPHYKQYLLRSVHMDAPDRNAVCVRTQLYGDNKFLTHKYTRVYQPYFRTALQLSDTRPTDDIVAKPLDVMHAEITIPFPAQHPFTSHISKFAVFPGTEPVSSTVLPPLATPPVVDSSTQTQPTDLPAYGYLVPRPTAPFYVLKKASESKVRVERHHLLGEAASKDVLGERSTLWDLPRSQRHKRATTYPAPMVQCPVHPSPISPGSREALRSIYHRVMLSTSYSEHFSSTRLPSDALGNRSLPPLPSHTTLLEDCPSMHHHYHGRGQDTSGGRGQDTSGGRGQDLSGGRGHDTADDEDEDTRMIPEPTRGDGNLVTGVDHSVLGRRAHCTPPTGNDDVQRHHIVQSEATIHPSGHERLDKATQTDPDPNSECPPTEDQEYCDTLPTLSSCRQRSLTYPAHVRTPCLPSLSPTPEPHAPPPYTPRSALVAERMGSLLRFSRSEARRRFHAMYPEEAPNLKEHKHHNENERRHVINGYNAYYYH